MGYDAMLGEMPGALDNFRLIVQSRRNSDTFGMRIDRAFQGLVEEPRRQCPMRPVGADVIAAGIDVGEAGSDNQHDHGHGRADDPGHAPSGSRADPPFGSW